MIEGSASWEVALENGVGYLRLTSREIIILESSTLIIYMLMSEVDFDVRVVYDSDEGDDEHLGVTHVDDVVQIQLPPNSQRLIDLRSFVVLRRT